MGRLLNVILSLALWRNYKTLILSSLVLALGIYAIAALQTGYIDSQLAEKQLDPRYVPPLSVSASFYLKWLVYATLVMLWFVYNRWRNHLGRIREANTALTHLLARKPRRNEAETRSEPISTTDPFERIRRKDKLRSEADLVIERKS